MPLGFDEGTRPLPKALDDCLKCGGRVRSPRLVEGRDFWRSCNEKGCFSCSSGGCDT